MYKNAGHDQRQKLQTPSGHATAGYTTKEVEEMRTALNKKLGPEFISKRKGPGFNSVQYLEGWKAINLANEIFGPNGWSTELREFKVDYIDDKHGAISLGLSCIVRVILKDGTFHEDVGYGSIENCRGKAMAFDKCKKEAFTDGMKRALRQFGNALGNCLYDKEFLQQITKVASEPVKFDANLLMRRSTTVPKAASSSTMTPTPTLVPKVEHDVRPSRVAPPADRTEKVVKRHGSGSSPERRREGKHKGKDDKAEGEGDDSFIFSDDWPEDEDMDEQILDSNNFVKNEDLPDSDLEGDSTVSKPEQQQQHAAASGNAAASAAIPQQVTFVPATSADTIQQDPSLQKSLKFDVSFSSAQLQKSSFINHSKSLPVKKSQVRHDDNKENKTRRPAAAAAPAFSASSSATVSSTPELHTADTTAAAPNPSTAGSSLGVRSPASSNTLGVVTAAPLVKRSFGLPPNKLPNKRLKK